MGGLFGGYRPTVPPLDAAFQYGTPGMFPQQQSAPAPEAPQRWLDGGKFKARDALGLALGAIGDAFTRQPVAASMVNDSFAQRRAMADKLRMLSLQRDQNWQDWQRQYDYEAAHPKPTNNDTVADYQFIQQNLGPDAAKEFLQNKANPPQYRQGPDGNFYRIDTSGTAPPTAPVGRLTPLDDGGPTPRASGGFPQ